MLRANLGALSAALRTRRYPAGNQNYCVEEAAA